MRVRSAEFKDGRVEQIVQTMNASRKGFYFHTALHHYYPGMRLRIIAPFHDHARAADLEEMAHVVRVDDKSGSYGVAVMRGVPLEAPQPAAESQPVVMQTGPTTERRSHRRSAFVATVEMADIRTGAISRARTADLSLCGCYIDTLNPLPIGAMVDVSIHKANECLKVLGNVCMQCQGSGMGVSFDALTREQSAIVKSWLEQAAIDASQNSG
jgi:hypothetical protein